MNGLTAGLLAAQQSLSPGYTLAIGAAPRATGGGLGGDPWEWSAALPAGLAAWGAQGIAADAAPGPNGILRAFLSWQEGSLATQHIPAAAVDAPTGWTAPAVAQVAAFAPQPSITVYKPAVVWDGARWHLFALLPDRSIRRYTSTDDGATWSAPATLYTGGDAHGDLFACWDAGAATLLLAFATGVSAPALRGAASVGGGAFAIWPAHAETGWLPAGIALAAEGPVLFAWQRTSAPYRHTLGRLGCAVGSGGALAARDSAVRPVWMVEGDGTPKPAAHAVGRGFGQWLHACQEVTAGRAWACAGAITPATGAGLDAHSTVEEPALLSGDPLPLEPLDRHFVPLEFASRTIVAGLAQVWRSAHRADLLEATGDDVISARLESPRDGPGSAELLVRAGSALAWAEPGFALRLERRCRKDSQEGAVALGYRICRIEAHDAVARLLALDALGILAGTLARRPFQIAEGALSLARAVESLCAWAGLPAAAAGLAGDAPLFQWQAGEDGLSALRRLLRASPARLMARAQGATALDVAPGLIVEGAEAPAATYRYGSGGHPLVQRVRVDDGRAPRLAVAHGLLVRNQPQEGEEWAIEQAGDPSPLLRPTPACLLDRYAGAAGLDALAAARGARLRRALPAGWIDAQAHLALEPHDRILVHEREYHVSRIVERWDRRRLLQRVELAAA